MNDEIMEKNVSVQTETNKNLENERKKNEDNFLKIARTKKNLATTWKIIFVLEFLLCQ
jgi:hypothetical protein